MSNDLLKRVLKNSKSVYKSVLKTSQFYNREDEYIPTDIPMLNAALGGGVDKGFSTGVTVIAGASRSFKTLFGLYMVRAFQNKYPDGVVLFYDSEFGTPKDYIVNMGLDTDRIAHMPITCVEDFRHDISKQIDDLKNNGNKDDKIMIFVDSLGNLASRKEIQDAIDGKDKADMTRAKVMKSLFRIITADINILDIPMVCIQHTYKSQEMYSSDIVAGGTGQIYAGDNIFVIGKQQDKQNAELKGFKFVININKSRKVKEKLKFPITVESVDRKDISMVILKLKLKM
jgi:RecA/RadA recombinase